MLCICNGFYGFNGLKLITFFLVSWIDYIFYPFSRGKD